MRLWAVYLMLKCSSLNIKFAKLILHALYCRTLQGNKILLTYIFCVFIRQLCDCAILTKIAYAKRCTRRRVRQWKTTHVPFRRRAWFLELLPRPAAVCAHKTKATQICWHPTTLWDTGPPLPPIMGSTCCAVMPMTSSTFHPIRTTGWRHNVKVSNRPHSSISSFN